ncbi:MAG: efflux RND transporter permease subunit [Acidobacteria bacterium]|nr:efflux RND transporter permease subunit [Acidobacteriota bacterium]
MLNRIISWSLQNRFIVLVASALMILFGLRSAQQAPLDVFPDFAPPQVIVQTEAPGFSPEEVEALVTSPIEATLNGTSSLTNIRSQSLAGISVITCTFEAKTNLFLARQLVNEKLSVARAQLPTTVHDPQMTPIQAPVGMVMKMTLTSDTVSPAALRDLAEWTIKPRLLAVPGISQVLILGGDLKEYQVIVSPERLRAYAVTLDEVMAATTEANRNAGGGFMVSPSQSLSIQGEGRIHHVEDIANAVVAVKNNVPVTVGEVAAVHIGAAFKLGDASLDGKPCVFLTVMKLPWANTLNVTEDADRGLDEIKKSLPAGVNFTTNLFRQSEFINVALANVNRAMLEGAVLVILVLTLFLFSWRSALISLLAIPLSLIAAILVLTNSGATLNIMTLGGLAIAIGEVVDDAIIDVENVYRRLRENHASPKPEAVLSVIYKAAVEVRGSVVFATLIVVLVFLPIFKLSGLEGAIFAPLGIAYITAILASLLVALVITPALCYLLLPKAAATHHQDSLTVRFLKRLYEPILNGALHHPYLLATASLLMLAASLAIVPFLGGEFLPQFKEGNFVILTEAKVGTSLEEMMRVGHLVEQRLHQIPDVINVAPRVGRAELDEDPAGTNRAEIDVKINLHGRKRDAIAADARQALENIKGVDFEIESYLSERIAEVMSGTTASLAVKLFGPDLDTLKQKGEQIEAAMKGVKGIVDLKLDQQTGIPKVVVQYDHAQLARYGLSSAKLSRLIEAAFRGQVVSQVIEGQRSYNLMVRYPFAASTTLANIQHTLVDTPTGARIELGSLAQVSIQDGPAVIEHEAAQRFIVVHANAAGRDISSVVKDVQAAVAAQVTLPTSYYLEYGGEYAAQQAATRQLALLGGAALLGIILLLYVALGAPRLVALVLVNLPLALIGGIVAIVVSGGTQSVASLIGLIALFGITMRNSIMLISHYQHLMEAEGLPFGEALARRGAMERLSPILMTACAAGLGLLPIAISVGEPGRELQQPMAVVILGGLISSTILNLLVIPTLFLKFGKRVKAESRQEGSESQ